MNNSLRVLVIAIAVTSMALTPVLLIQNVNADTHSCADQTKKSSAWIQGCKDGWYDHDHCYSYTGGSGEYGKGYAVGWDKGRCK